MGQADCEARDGCNWSGDRCEQHDAQDDDRDANPMMMIMGFAMPIAMLGGTGACVVTGYAPDKRKGCFGVSTREESPCNWYASVGICGCIGVVGLIFQIVRMTGAS